ncbi:MAG: hypothetical protein ACJAV5_000471 [Vicingaceae bacterium]|jgi:hypothetical protein
MKIQFKIKSSIAVLAALFFFIAAPLSAQAQKKKSKKGSTTAAAPGNKTGPKPYAKVITKEAESEVGLFSVHRVDDNYYFELPNNLLEKEILIVSRISGHVKGLNFGGAGMKSRPQQVIRFQKLNNKILMRSVSYNNVAVEGTPIYTSVLNNNFEPIISAFSIAAFSKDTSSVVIDVTDLFTTDVEMIGALGSSERKNFKIKGLDKGRSLITGMDAFPENVQVKHILTYKGDELPANRTTGTISIGMTQSFILLPEVPMEPRFADNRVGFFSLRQVDYGSEEQKAETRRLITRWRLEPKDWEAYNRGELVEPVKPIVYYIDAATPEKWKKYIKQGVDDWAKAFESAGFKNAIRGEYAPTPEEDPHWSPEDVRYSVIRYIATDIQNAQGPHVHDPRSGEILESDILWYHNIMNLLRNWYFIHTAAVNPEARGVKFDDEVMGQLIRFVSAHEVGHTLGLPHNMGSSVAYPVDSLRSPSFTSTHGTAPSIMDYARFNYIAQPEDGVTSFFPQIGEYDNWSIEFGYKLLGKEVTAAQEESEIDNWILAKAGQPQFHFGRQQGNPTDPTAQTEDLGDDAINASALGIKNLKRINDKLLEWATEDGEEYDDLDELYNAMVGQYRRYMGHVTANVGGIEGEQKTADQEGVIYEHTEKVKQKRAVDFLNEQLFATPEWIVKPEILARIEAEGNVNRIKSMQERALSSLLSDKRLFRMIENEAINGTSAYVISELLNDLEKGIYSELASGKKIDLYRRNLQKAYVAELIDLLEDEKSMYMNSDIPSLARASLVSLQSKAKSGAAKQSGVSKAHLQDLAARIEKALSADRG